MYFSTTYTHRRVFRNDGGEYRDFLIKMEAKGGGGRFLPYGW